MRSAFPGARAGRIFRCPYPSHADGDPSWRWDEPKARARCSCSKGDSSIFDVVMKVEGVDFDAAKLRVAELLGRSDLIQEAGGHQRFQAIDAASLLRPPPDQRDDGLPLAYLAHRLGVAVEQVPRPTTPMAGFKSLAYFDPPAPGSRAKPKLVGHYPCAVFGTLAADGRRHAHRIYVAPSGAGKAELGVGPNGRPRDPKKSAKVTGEQSTAGCAVLWGDPSKAPHLLLTEGIETGAAVALVFLPEIEQGQVAVAAAISAGGLEAFQPWPATKRVTVAADRDEGAKADGRPGSRRGEQAARRFGLLHSDNIGDRHRAAGRRGRERGLAGRAARDGPQAVREGLLAAEPFVATAGEREAAKEKREQLGKLEAIARTYPLPEMDTLELRYDITASGRIKVHKLVGWNKDPETGREGAGAGAGRDTVRGASAAAPGRRGRSLRLAGRWSRTWPASRAPSTSTAPILPGSVPPISAAGCSRPGCAPKATARSPWSRRSRQPTRSRRSSSCADQGGIV